MRSAAVIFASTAVLVAWAFILTADAITRHHVTSTFVLINGSLVPVAHNPGTSNTSGVHQGVQEEESSGISGSLVAATIIATVLFNVTFIGSLLLIVTVWSSLTLNRYGIKGTYTFCRFYIYTQYYCFADFRSTFC